MTGARAMLRIEAALSLAALAFAPSLAAAQNFGAAFAGFNGSSDKPIQIEADRLEVRDADKVAVYDGHVRVLQGDTLMEAPEMRVFYTSGPQPKAGPAPGAAATAPAAPAKSASTTPAASAGATPAAAAPAAAAPASGPIAGSSVSRIEAGPGVTVHSGDHTATGDQAVFDMTKNLVTLEGHVVLTQGDNVVRGDRLVVNLTTKEGRVEGGRVQTLITPSNGKTGKPTKPAKP